ncbi:MAG: Nif3-like dinuclear metal center hexameric protein [Clostridiaceae bacterium]|nr:Nif3-like dinuclear metal center hexameric protein [Clostridiaceae bacterium]
MDAKDLYAALAVQFQPEACTEVFPVKGLQTDHCRQVERVYTATFASREVFNALKHSDARRCVLFTHHPVPQRPVDATDYPPISKEDLALMRAREISLFSYHIPLDRNGPYSPGTNLVRVLGATPRAAFYLQNGVYMGLICDSPFRTAEEAADTLGALLGHRTSLYPYGGSVLENGRLAVMCGGAKDATIYEFLRAQGCNAFITGVTSLRAAICPPIHKAAQRAGVSLIGGTHYSTEKFAPMAMVDFFKALRLPCEFLSETPQLDEL